MRRIGLGVGKRIALAARPELLLDLVHQRLVVRMHHQRHVLRGTGFHDAEQFPMIVHADAGHVRITAPGVDHHEYLECGDAGLRHGRHFVEQRRGRIEVPVDDRISLVDRELLVQQVQLLCRQCL